MRILFRVMAASAALTLPTLAVLSLQPEAIPQPKQEGIEVLTRGPIHEAFAQPTASKPTAPLKVTKKPPEPINEIPPDQKPEGDQVQWIPGYWAFDDERADFLWVSGIWRAPPPDRHWLPGYWQQVEGGFAWTSGYWGVRADATVELLPAPPEPVEEAVPVQPNVNTIYVPGVWMYRENRYGWRPGHWMACHPGWVWSPAHYYWTPGGYVFVNGFWDYDLDHRGICFAPAYFDARVYQRPGWAYRPRHAIAADFLLGSLFVHVGANQYYFGDYYDPAYARRGFTPWVDLRIGGSAFDPLFGYYRWQHRGDAGWETALRTQYTARRDNPASRPPKTLAQQEKVAAADPKLQVAVPLEKWKSPAFKMEAVSKAQHDEILKHTEQFRNFGKQRGKIETDVKPNVPSPKSPTPAPPVKIELPKSPIKQPETKKAPPTPEVPKVLPNPPAPKEKAPKEKDKDKGPKKDKNSSVDREDVSIGRVESPWLLFEAPPRLPWPIEPRFVSRRM